ncbi:hypothetical protein [Pelagicoccus albus]|uniref:Uncharacterized protein n=1 Tax=Pelagicoccus albus TaxID=415222 RepID=A0A7X1EAF4_9BACT|nr:hypothetical protein [Pelagicoccus albus]MBC2606727.1 hypothetical protein [Pelagicoccus albus]
MKCESFYSKKLNLVLEVMSGTVTVDDVIELKSIPVKEGVVNAMTRVLVLCDSEIKLTVNEAYTIAPRLMEELPEYSGTRTALVASRASSTAVGFVLANQLSRDQSLGTFSTLGAAMSFLHLTSEELSREFPQFTTFSEAYAE